MNTVWHRGVPWVGEALTEACIAGVADAVTEVARGLIEVAKHDPSSITARRAVRGPFTAVVSDELVVIGYEIAGDDDPAPEEEQERARGRGPRSWEELEEWLADEGFAVVAGKGNHRAVLGAQGQRLVTYASTPSDRRALPNNVSVCRRVLGIELRRKS